MKLVEILARELDEWPEPDEDCGLIESMSQAADLQVSHYAGVRQKWLEDIGDWEGGSSAGYVPCSRFTLSQLATDHATAIVTRADWEAERAKLKAPKADAGGWVRHRGGKCPVDGDTVVDIRCRNGRVHEGEPAYQFIWKHSNDIGDAMAYRIHKPAEQPDEHDLTRSPKPAPVNLPEGYGQVVTATLDSVSGPLEWRDRIRELDTQRAEVESTYQHQISEITQERESLVQKLAGEGLALVEVLVQPVEDMSDYRKWREGDLLTLVSGHISDNDFTSGNQYKFLRVDEWDEIVVIDDAGDENGYGVNSGMFKWHSRPAR